MRSRLLALSVLLAGCGQPAAPPTPALPSVAELANPAGGGSGQPHLAAGPGGILVMSWIEPVTGGHSLRYARLEAGRWSQPMTVAIGDDWFVNWADFPSVVPITDSLWAAHWLAKSTASAYAYDVVMGVSADSGETWSEAFSPHVDGTPTEHGFVSLFAWQDDIGSVWLDGRNMVGGSEAKDTEGGMTLRSARISGSGVRLGADLIDERVCDCCQTDAVVTSAGPLVAYRNRSRDEIRDIQVSALVGDDWGEPITVHEDEWQIAGCPVNGPALSARAERVGIAWFTAAHDPVVYFAHSDDAGASFAAPIVIDGSRPLGRVDIVTLASGDYVVSWVRAAGEARGELCLRRVRSDGGLGDVIVVSQAEPSRQIGFPQMLVHGDALVLAWTSADGESGSHRVRTRLVTLADL